ncbi:NADP-dependent malic enzyme [Candidatus Saccharibacteria bacterium]|nr:NADP-dependent malic enzyme [Candidatus Saccharibacteria bacterium]
MIKSNYQELALQLHKKLHGKIVSQSKIVVKDEEDLSLVYTPGVGAVSSLLANKPELASQYTIKNNTVAVISDGSAVLGLGNIGPYGALPVMEGKAMLFSQLGGLNAFPIVLNTQEPEEIIQTIINIAPVFSAINLEDIAAPQCFEIEKRLQATLDIPVVHDDQHATAIVVLAGLINSLKVVGKQAQASRVVLLGAGAAGVGVAKLLISYGFKDIIVVDSTGIIDTTRTDLTPEKRALSQATNTHHLSGNLEDAVKGADIFIGLSTGGKLPPSYIKSMNTKPIIFALANPEPEILPNDALKAGAAVVASGRSDFVNQINNVLVFPGLFKGLINHSITELNDTIKLKAAQALADVVSNPMSEIVIPSVFDSKVVEAIAQNIG